jgi:hypothetical protein
MAIYRHKVQGVGEEGDIWITTMHSQGASSIDAVHGAWQTAVTDFITNTIGPMWNTHQSANLVQTDQIDPLTSKNLDQRVSTVNLVGTGTGSSPAQRNCVLLSERTNLPTRAGRGRMYWPSPDGSHYTNVGQFVAADMQTLANGWKTVMDAFRLTSIPIIWHKKFGNFDVIVRIEIPVNVATQRRRNNKIPPNYQSATF